MVFEGVHLDEPSSPLSKQFEEDLDDFVSQLTNPKHHTAKVQPIRSHRFEQDCVKNELRKSPTDKQPNMKQKSYCYDKRDSEGLSEKKHSSKGLRRILGNRSSHDTNFSKTKFDKKDSIEESGEVSASISSSSVVDEDEGLGIHEIPHHLDNVFQRQGDTCVSFNCDTTPETSDGESSLRSSDAENSPKDLDKTAKCNFEGIYIKKEKDSKDKESRKRRFRKMITKPLRRSHSAGCEKDLEVPAHALFLQYSIEETDTNDKEKCTGGVSLDHGGMSARRMVHKTCSADAAMMASEDLPDGQGLTKSKSKTSLARNVKKKLQALRRRNTDSALGTSIMKISGMRVSKADALEWSKTFEALLHDKNGLDLFRLFLKSEFSDENLEFWIACEEFKTIKTNKLVARAHKIYSDFVAVSAPKEINLDSNTRVETTTNLENPTRETFRAAQKRIQGLMEKDPYPRFLESETYLQIIGDNSSEV